MIRSILILQQQQQQREQQKQDKRHTNEISSITFPDPIRSQEHMGSMTQDSPFPATASRSGRRARSDTADAIDERPSASLVRHKTIKERIRRTESRDETESQDLGGTVPSLTESAPAESQATSHGGGLSDAGAIKVLSSLCTCPVAQYH